MLLSVLLVSCKGRAYQDISVTSARLVSVVPEGLSGLNAVVEIGVHNPAGEIRLSDLSAMAKYRGQDALLITAEPVTLEGRTDQLYTIPLQGRLAENFNPLQLLTLAGGGFTYDDLTVSLRCRASLRGGFGKVIEMEDMPLGQLLNQLEQHEENY